MLYLFGPNLYGASTVGLLVGTPSALATPTGKEPNRRDVHDTVDNTVQFNTTLQIRSPSFPAPRSYRCYRYLSSHMFTSAPLSPLWLFVKQYLASTHLWGQGGKDQRLSPLLLIFTASLHVKHQAVSVSTDWRSSLRMNGWVPAFVGLLIAFFSFLCFCFFVRERLKN